MSTIHNPVNFEPRDYVVVDYLDNQPPQPPHPGFGAYNPGAYANLIEEWKKERDAWHARIAALNVQGGIHRCCHCGNGNVRYITVCFHEKSGRNVCFGTDCTARLDLPGASEFKAKFIRTAANTHAIHLAKLAKIAEVLAKNPGLQEALACASNSFIADVRSKFERNGELSERQIEAVIASAKRDAEYKARREAEKANRGPVPVGQRITFEGSIVSRRKQDGQFGIQHKCLIKLDNGAAIWMTEPASCTANIGDRLTIRATVEASKDDPSFGFAKRPHLISQTPAATESGPRNNVGAGA